MFFQYQIKLQIAKNSFYIEPSTSKERFHNGFAMKSTIHYAQARKYLNARERYHKKCTLGA